MIIWQERAQRDAARLSDYVSRENPKAAADIQIRIVGMLRQLEAFPFSGVKGEITGTRQLIVQPYPYVMIYRAIAPDRIEILRILHTSQQWP